MSCLRRLYDWTLSWGESNYALVALFLISFAESSFFPIPPDVLLIPLVLGAPQRWFLIATVCLAGSVLGGLAGYGIGFGAMETVGAWIISTLQLESSVEAFKSKYNQWGDWIVFIAGFSPIPYKVVTILSGAMRMDISSFVFFSIVGRGARFYVVSVLLYFFGNPIRKFIEKYFNLFTIIFVLLLVGGFLVVKFVKL